MRYKRIFRLVIGGVLFLFVFFLFSACPEPPQETPKRDTSINLEVLNTFTTTARLHISVEDTTAEWTFGLTRNDEDILTATVYNSDTTFIDNDLNPGTQYNYQVQWLEDGIAVDSSLKVFAQTLDISSHNFTWEIDTIGEAWSQLWDVGYISEDDIWLGGEIYIDDDRFALAHWDGVEWEFIDLFYSGTIRSIEVFNSNNVWFSSGCSIYKWNGIEIERLYACDFQIEDLPVLEIWSRNENDIYFVGTEGTIIHFNGSDFIEIDSGTDLPFLRITGNEEFIFIGGFSIDMDEDYRSMILQIHQGEIDTLFFTQSATADSLNQFGYFDGMDVYGDTLYFYSSEAGIVKYNYLTYEKIIVPYSYDIFRNHDFFHSLIVNSVTDVILINLRGFFIHFNGINWQEVNGAYVFGMRWYNRARIEGDNLFLVGTLYYDGGRFVIGSRN